MPGPQAKGGSEAIAPRGAPGGTPGQATDRERSEWEEFCASAKLGLLLTGHQRSHTAQYSTIGRNVETDAEHRII